MDNPIPQSVTKLLNYDPFGMLLVGRNSEAGSEYRYGFNTQEQDDEVYGNGNLNTAEFWEYDTRLGRRWNIDPKPSESYSNFLCFKNNPVSNTDIKGDTVSRFNQKGQFLEMVEFDKPGMLGQTGSYIGETWYADKIFFFNDPKVDFKQLAFLKNGEQALQIISNEEVNSIMNSSDIYWRNAKQRYEFAGTESGSHRDRGDGNKMDFGVVYLESSPGGGDNDLKGGFFIMADEFPTRAYNANDAGQWLWGHAMNKLGFTYSETRFASDANEFFKDPEADQEAIRNGYNHEVKTDKQKDFEVKNSQ